MAQMKKNPVSGKTVKTTTYSILTPFKKNVKMVNERTTRKPVAKPAAKPAPKSGPMRRTTMADRIQDAKNVQPKGPAKPKTTKAKQPVGPAAVKAIQDRTSPAGVKKAEMDAKKAIDKKYPGLYKK